MFGVVQGVLDTVDKFGAAGSFNQINLRRAHNIKTHFPVGRTDAFAEPIEVLESWVTFSLSG